MIKKFHNLLALVVMGMILAVVWILQGIGVANFPEVIIGATIVWGTQIVQYYFRKKAPAE